MSFDVGQLGTPGIGGEYFKVTIPNKDGVRMLPPGTLKLSHFKRISGEREEPRRTQVDFQAWQLVRILRNLAHGDEQQLNHMKAHIAPKLRELLEELEG